MVSCFVCNYACLYVFDNSFPAFVVIVIENKKNDNLKFLYFEHECFFFFIICNATFYAMQKHRTVVGQ